MRTGHFPENKGGQRDIDHIIYYVLIGFKIWDGYQILNTLYGMKRYYLFVPFNYIIFYTDVRTLPFAITKMYTT